MHVELTDFHVCITFIYGPKKDLIGEKKKWKSKHQDIKIFETIFLKLCGSLFDFWFQISCQIVDYYRISKSQIRTPRLTHILLGLMI